MVILCNFVDCLYKITDRQNVVLKSGTKYLSIMTYFDIEQETAVTSTCWMH